MSEELKPDGSLLWAKREGEFLQDKILYGRKIIDVIKRLRVIFMAGVNYGREQRMQHFIKILCEAPDDQIAPEMVQKLKAIQENPTSAALEEILADCVKYSLASDFAMNVMNWCFQELKKKEGE